MSFIKGNTTPENERLEPQRTDPERCFYIEHLSGKHLWIAVICILLALGIAAVILYIFSYGSQSLSGIPNIAANFF